MIIYDNNNFVLTTNKEIGEKIIDYYKKMVIGYKIQIAKYFYIHGKLLSIKDRQPRLRAFQQKTKAEQLSIYQYIFLDYPTTRFIQRLFWKIIIIICLGIMILISISHFKTTIPSDSQDLLYYSQTLSGKYLLHAADINDNAILGEINNECLLIDNIHSQKTVIKMINDYCSTYLVNYTLTNINFSHKFIYIYLEVPYKYNNKAGDPNHTINENELDKVAAALINNIQQYTYRKICIRYYMHHTNLNTVYYSYVQK